MRQVFNHEIKDLGLKVHFKSEAEAEFNKKEGNVLAQIDKSKIEPSELAILGSNLIQRFCNNEAYGIPAYTANYLYICNYYGEGEFDIIEVDKIDSNIKEEINDYKGDSTSIDRRSIRDEAAKRQRGGNSYNAQERGSNADNDRLDSETPQGESIKLQGDNDSGKHKTGSEVTQDFTTPQGEVYGFVTKNGEIYLDETKISPEHPMHEYTHLWDMVVQKKNPELWNKGKAGTMAKIKAWF